MVGRMLLSDCESHMVYDGAAGFKLYKATFLEQ